MFFLWFLQREKGFEFSSQARKEAKESKSSSSKELVYQV